MNQPSTPSWSVELSLVVVDLVVAASFARLFVGTSFLAPLAGIVLVGHALAIATRRLGVPGPAVVAVALAGGAVTLAVAVLGDTTAYGLPTAETWDGAVQALRTARTEFPRVIAPTEPLAGFLLAGGAALWAAAWFSDWAEHRLDASAEALGPAAIFAFCSILGSGDHRLVAAAAFAASSLAFVGLARADRVRRRQAWSPTTPRTVAALRRSALGVAAVVVVAGTALAPVLPGARLEAALSWREGTGGDRSRVTVSPMVELRKRLVEQSDVEVFQVRSEQRSYWRLTALDRFDGEIWSSSGEYRSATERLPRSEPTTTSTRRFPQTVEIRALSTIWAPSAFDPVGVRDESTPLRWDPESSTLIVDSSRPTSDGLTYTVVSEAPTYEPEVLEAATRADPDDLADRYEGLPDDFPASVVDQAQAVTAEGRTRYEQALALQSWFRTTFDYSLDAPPGHGESALVDFLDTKVGYCEQFAGAYAAMARSLGIPSRVAVGFTPGSSSDREPGVYHVLGRHAHAWPELYFPGVGWVPFEPTPQRGMPGAEAYTGVREQQASSPVTTPTTAPTTTPSTAAPSAGSTPPTGAGPEQTRTEAADAPADPDPGPSRWWVAAVAALGVAALGGVVVAGRARRTRRARELGRADAAWARVQSHLARSFGLVRQPSETHRELAARAGPALGPAADDLERLATLVTRERWAAEGLGDAEVAEVEALADRLVQAAPERVRT